MVDAHTISRTEMVQHLAAGHAEPLLSDGVPGPVRLADRWWAVPAGDDQYRPVTDPAAVAALDDGLARLRAHRQHRTEILGHKGELRL